MRGTLHIGYLTAVRLLDLPSLLESFHTEHPDVALRLRVSPSGSAGLARSLLAGRLDLAILSLPGAPGRPPAGLTLRQVASVPMVLVAPAGHRLAARDAVSLADLSDEQFIDFPVAYGNRDLVDRPSPRIERRLALEVTDISAASAFVRHRLGIAFLPEFAALPDEAGVRVVNYPVVNAGLLLESSLAVMGSAASSSHEMRVSSGAVDWAPQTHMYHPRWAMLWDALWSA
ncbi:LysR substrate-binding domain-containing protein [Streptomyces sp. NPDC056390]|uniref:LysR substrate-binding domain-containing protein n=1 Tax=Streptomyces sp. NPDC056390 TaxID=3345806 RepID=UPI0035E15CB0